MDLLALLLLKWLWGKEQERKNRVYMTQEDYDAIQLEEFKKSRLVNLQEFADRHRS